MRKLIISLPYLAMLAAIASIITLSPAYGQSGTSLTDPIEQDAEAATTIGNSTTTTTTIPSFGIELSPQPVYQEQLRDQGTTPINQTHLQITYSGSGTLYLPNGTETTIRTTSTGSGIASMIDNDFAGIEILTTEDGSESATARVYELVRFNMQDGNGRGITMAVFHTNSTGMLAPLDGMILAGITELNPDGTGSVTLWEWQSGIPLLTTTTATDSVDETTDQQDATTQAANVTTEGGVGEGSTVANQPSVTTSSPNELQAPVEQPQSFTEEQLPDSSEEAPVEEEEGEDEEDAETEEEEEQEEETDCHPSYPDFCIPPPPPNLNCDDVSGGRFTVLSPDPHGLDGRDNDGIGCES